MGHLNSTYPTEIPGLRYRLGVNGEKTYCTDKQINGVKLRRSLGQVSFKEAKDRFFRLIANFSPTRTVNLSINDMQIQHFLSKYYEESFQNTKNPKKWYSLLRTLRDKLGDVYFLDLNKAVIDKYKHNRSKDIGKNTQRPISPRTIQAELGLLRAAINHAVDMQLIPNNPISRFCNVKQDIPLKIVIDNGEPWGPEWTSIYRTLGDTTFTKDKHNQAVLQLLFLTLYETGMRPNEVLHMEWGWIRRITHERYFIVVPRHINKTGQGRNIPISPLLLKSLSDFKSKSKLRHSLIFPSPVTNNVRYEGTINKPFNTAVKNSGITQIVRYTPYALRRTRISIWDAIDEGACESAVGHTPKNVHRKHYSVIQYDRLFKLVGL